MELIVQFLKTVSGTRGTESWNELTVLRGEVGGEDSLKEGERISQRTYMKDPWI